MSGDDASPSDKTPAEAFDELADAYAASIDTKPHNAYYDRPALLSLAPDMAGRLVLDAGCGPGAYMEALLDLGADVAGFDASPRMIGHAKARLGRGAKVLRADLSRALPFADLAFDGVLAALSLDGVEDWNRVFREFRRVLKPGGWVLFSAGHPSFDAQYFDTEAYFSIERVECDWTGFGETVRMPSYRRSIQEFFMPIINAGLRIDAVLEPLPTRAFRAADPERYRALTRRPCFLCVRACNPA